MNVSTKLFAGKGDNDNRSNFAPLLCFDGIKKVLLNKTTIENILDQRHFKSCSETEKQNFQNLERNLVEGNCVQWLKKKVREKNTKP